MVEVLVKLKLDMQAVFNADLHFHLRGGLCLLHIAVVMQDCEIILLYYSCLHIPIDNNSDKIPDSACNTIEGLVLFLEVGELEFKDLVLGQDASRFEFLRQRVELG